jgi:hypothetical protein
MEKITTALTSLAEPSKQGSGSKRAVLPMIMIMMMTTMMMMNSI